MTRSAARTLAVAATAALLAAVALGCEPPEEPLDNNEAREALDEATLSTQAQSLTSDTIEVTTDFTIGMAVEDAAQELADFIKSQIPCTTVTREAATLTVDYGTLEDACLWRGKTYAGVHTVTLMKNDPGVVELSHSWADFTNGNVTVNGAATVTWDGEAKTRRVEHDLEWTNGQTTANGSGDRTQSLIDDEAGLSGGIQIDGTRAWETARGSWDLTIDGVQVRGEDPLPQAGTYTLTTPADKTLTLTFTRIDDNTIEARMEGTRRPRTFRVTRAGAVSEAPEG